MGDLRRAALLEAGAVLLLWATPGEHRVELSSDGLLLWFRWIDAPYPGLEWDR